MRYACNEHGLEIPQCAVDNCTITHQPRYHKYLDIYARFDSPLHNEESTTKLRDGDQIIPWKFQYAPNPADSTSYIYYLQH